MWFVWSVLTGVLESAKDVYSKKSTKNNSKIASSFYYEGVSVIFFIVLFGIEFLFINDNLVIADGFWTALLIGAFTKPIWIYLYFVALESGDLSKVLPYLALTPVFTLVLGIPFDGELPNMIGILGVIIVSMSLYFGNLKRSGSIAKTLTSPFTNIDDIKPVLAIIGVAALWALGAHIAKFETISSSVNFSSLVSSIVSSLIFLGIMIVKREKFTMRSDLLINGTLNAISKFTIRTALVSAPFTVYVFSIKRLSIVLSSLYGIVVLKEQFNALKVVSLFSLAIGILFIVLS